MSKEFFNVEGASSEEMAQHRVLMLAKAFYPSEEDKENGEYRLQVAMQDSRGQLVDTAINILADVTIRCSTTGDGNGELNPSMLLDFYKEIKQKIKAAFGGALWKFTLNNPDVLEKMRRVIAEEENEEKEQ